MGLFKKKNCMYCGEEVGFNKHAVTSEPDTWLCQKCSRKLGLKVLSQSASEKCVIDLKKLTSDEVKDYLNDRPVTPVQLSSSLLTSESKSPAETKNDTAPLSDFFPTTHVFEEWFGGCDAKYVLKYQYTDVAIVGAQYQDIDYSKLRPGLLTYNRETTNEHDPKAIQLISEGQVLGYIGRGKLQDMLNDFLPDPTRHPKAWLTDVNEDEQKLSMALAFYVEEPWEIIKEFKATLTKTSKRLYDGETRQNNLELVSEGDQLEISFDDNGDYVATDEYGGELGNISDSVVEKISDAGYDIDDAAAVVSEITSSSSGKIGAKIMIQIRG